MEDLRAAESEEGRQVLEDGVRKADRGPSRLSATRPDRNGRGAGENPPGPGVSQTGVATNPGSRYPVPSACSRATPFVFKFWQGAPAGPSTARRSTLCPHPVDNARPVVDDGTSVARVYAYELQRGGVILSTGVLTADQELAPGDEITLAGVVARVEDLGWADGEPRLMLEPVQAMT